MKKVNYKKVFSLISFGLAFSAINFFIAVLLIKWLWKKIADILFPKLVASGDVIVNLSFSEAFWITLMIMVIRTALMGKMVSGSKKTKKKLKDDLIENKK